MLDELGRVIQDDPRIAFALLFGSRARGSSHAGSDLDIAVGLVSGVALDATAVAQLVSRLEAAARSSVDLVLLDEAPPGLAYRVFRDGRPLVVKDRDLLARRLARAVLEYLDFKPVEDQFTEAVLRARHGR